MPRYRPPGCQQTSWASHVPSLGRALCRSILLPSMTLPYPSPSSLAHLMLAAVLRIIALTAVLLAQILVPLPSTSLRFNLLHQYVTRMVHHLSFTHRCC